METLNQKILNLLKNHLKVSAQRQPAPTFVLIGFPVPVLQSEEISGSRLFDVSVAGSIEQYAAQKKQLISRLVDSEGKTECTWCTFEQYALASPDVFKLYRKPSFLSSGLLESLMLPAIAFGGWAEYFEKLCNEPDEVDAFEEPPGEVIETFQSIYTGARIVDGTVYVTYESVPETIDELVASEDNREFESRGDEVELSIGSDENDLLRAIAIIGDARDEGYIIRIEPDLTPPSFVRRVRRLAWLLRDLPVRITVEERSKKQPEPKVYPEIEEILRGKFGLSRFRKLRVYSNVGAQPVDTSTVKISQADVINTIVEQAENAIDHRPFRDVFVTAPTGSGKSLMFQIPAMYLAESRNAMTIVVSPLIGLMNDQVQNLYLKDIDCAATINSGIPPTRKDEIYRQIQENRISVLYVSPETLLSRSDLSSLIGDRKVGLFVVDEAHIVTTWGKAFRSDYWYLGTYLQRIRREHPCLIATFTATAIFGGKEDMYVETRDSLNMVNPVTYFGYVPRQNIETAIQHLPGYKGKGHEYHSDKYAILLQRITELQSEGMKVLVYFPMIKYLQQFRDFVAANDTTGLSDQIGEYYGPLKASDKENAYRRFRDGSYSVMLATKAFGMGIDIADIGAVYHFAPTGNVCDYVQEIGRAARALPSGFAVLDYLPGDFGFVNQLHGISTLRKHQLVATIRKIMELYANGGYKRRLLINSEDFRHIFAATVNTKDDEIDNKLKTALLIIEKDFVNQRGYAAILARPRQLFTIEFHRGQPGIIDSLPNKISRYFRPIGADAKLGGMRYEVDLKSIWLSSYPNISFAHFKYRFRQEPDELGFPRLAELSPILRLELTLSKPVEVVRDIIKSMAAQVGEAFAEFTNPYRRFTEQDFATVLPTERYPNSRAREQTAAAVLSSAYVFCSLMKLTHNHYTWFLQRRREDGGYQLKSAGYQDYSAWLIGQFDQLVREGKVEGEKASIWVERDQRHDVLSWFSFLGALEELGIGSFVSRGDENPEIFVRINSPFALQRIVYRPDDYENRILDNVYERHRLSVAMLHFLFTEKAEKTDFWQTVERYFLGEIPKEVEMEMSAQNR